MCRHSLNLNVSKLTVKRLFLKIDNESNLNMNWISGYIKESWLILLGLIIALQVAKKVSVFSILM